MPRPKITRQAERLRVFHYIKEYRRMCAGQDPSNREIAEWVGISEGLAQDHVNGLQGATGLGEIKRSRKGLLKSPRENDANLVEVDTFIQDHGGNRRL
jgi:hypothetical protein